jgi:fatty acid desaturase
LQAEQEDLDLARSAHRITADLTHPRRAVYWADLTLTATVVYGGLAAAVQGEGVLRAAAAAACVLALYRAVSFIHELTHLRPRDVPGFGLAWNLLIGIPFLVPSLLYEGVHNLHHAKQRYGTAQDPEYLPLARGPAIKVVAFLGVALFAPLGSILRFAVGAPLAVVIPALRPVVFSRFSAITINPAFRREDVERSAAAAWRAQEVACWLWSWTLVALVASGGPRAAYVLAGAGLLAIVTCLNQLRTLVAHAWTNDGRRMTFAEQFADSINVPPPGSLPLLWAPVGLRYHALHHLLPRIPYHHLAEAHRRLSRALPPDSLYHRAQRRGLWPALREMLGRLAAHRQGGRRPRPVT